MLRLLKVLYELMFVYDVHINYMSITRKKIFIGMKSKGIKEIIRIENGCVDTEKINSLVSDIQGRERIAEILNSIIQHEVLEGEKYEIDNYPFSPQYVSTVYGR